MSKCQVQVLTATMDTLYIPLYLTSIIAEGVCNDYTRVLWDMVVPLLFPSHMSICCLSMISLNSKVANMAEKGRQ